VIAVEGLQSLQMRSRKLPIYDREIDIAELHIDERSGAEHYVIRYPEGLKAQPHKHTAAHTMVVLEGALNANGQELGPLSYCHFPAGEVMTHQPAEGQSCLFVLIFDGPFDVHPANE
jgi:quercetin dioxygenase-like cupin family protein